MSPTSASSDSQRERFGRIPNALRKQARWEKLVDGAVPAMLVHPSWELHGSAPPPSAPPPPSAAPPLVIWMHGRTVQKEIDPGRFLRWMRSGIAACAVDLPGHGERFERELQEAGRTLDVVSQMIDEIDPIVEELRKRDAFDMKRLAIGGMSAGGMATLARLCTDHPFTCASVEATSGSWEHQRRREMFRDRPRDEVDDRNPIAHLEGWREIPLQAIHARGDEWVSFEGQAAFIEALRSRYRRPDFIDFVVYEETGAPHEHAGFGRLAADAKNRQRDFFAKWLKADASPAFL